MTHDTEEDFNRNVCRQQLCFYNFISVCSRGWLSLLHYNIFIFTVYLSKTYYEAAALPGSQHFSCFLNLQSVGFYQVYFKPQTLCL